MLDSYNFRYPYQPVEKIKKRTAARRPHAGRTSIRDVIVMLKLRHHVASRRIQDFLEAFFIFSNIKCVLIGEQEKKIHYSCEDGIEKSVHRDHHLSSVGKPFDANR